MKKQWKPPEIKVIVSSSPQESVLGRCKYYFDELGTPHCDHPLKISKPK
jgi:hypothetical protein